MTNEKKNLTNNNGQRSMELVKKKKKKTSITIQFATKFVKFSKRPLYERYRVTFLTH